MLFDAHKVAPGSVLECDVCVIGAGFAGITAAGELDEGSAKVILLEAGGTKFDKRLQDLYRGEALGTNHGPLHLYRERRFGGTSHVWGGRCNPYDQIDMEARSWVEHSGWPVSRKEMDPFYARAFDACDLGRYALTTGELLPKHAASQMVSGLDSAIVKDDRPWLFSLPTNFAAKFGGQLRTSKQIEVYLNANCLMLLSDSSGAGVTHALVGTLDGKRFSVRARYFVLAMGGLETTRLLMLSGDIGNATGNLGRFYISHMTGNAGRVKFRSDLDLVWDYERTVDGVYCRRTLRIDPEVQRRDGLLNFRAILDFPSPADPTHGQAVLSAMYLLKRLFARRLPPEYNVDLTGIGRYQHVGSHFLNCLVGLPGLLAFGLKWLWARVLARRKLPSIVLRSHDNTYNLHFDAEQRPNPESRIYLGKELDEFGQRRLVVDWRHTDSDVESVVSSVTLLANELERCEVGSLEIDQRELASRVARTGVGSHHIGTTRMSADPRWGVVDRDCRVFGVDNLFIASSSTFPTSSYANPTLAIVAFAIRIADHIKGLLQPGTPTVTN